MKRHNKDVMTASIPNGETIHNTLMVTHYIRLIVSQLKVSDKFRALIIIKPKRFG